MIKKSQQSGFSHVLLLGLLVVVAVVGFAGYRVVNNQKDTTNLSDSTVKESAAVKVPDTIKDNTDLVQTQKAVEQTSVDSDLNPADLNQDVNDLQ
jgi:hypothetical protein